MNFIIEFIMSKIFNKFNIDEELKKPLLIIIGVLFIGMVSVYILLLYHKIDQQKETIQKQQIENQNLHVVIQKQKDEEKINVFKTKQKFINHELNESIKQIENKYNLQTPDKNDTVIIKTKSDVNKLDKLPEDQPITITIQ